MAAAEKPPEQHGELRDEAGHRQRSHESTEKKYPTHHATLPAVIVEALGPMMRETMTHAWSFEAHCNQERTELYGTYILPREGSVIVVCMSAHRFIALRTTEAHATEPLKVYFPDAMVERATAERLMIQDEGDPIEIFKEPRPRQVICMPFFGMVSIDHEHEWQRERFPGTLGSWSNQDHGNVIIGDSYRCEVVEARALSIVEGMLAQAGRVEQPISGLHLNPEDLSAMSYAAKSYGCNLVRISFDGTEGMIVMRSDDGNFISALMPCRPPTPTKTA